jgi:predicted Zn-dependent protease
MSQPFRETTYSFRRLSKSEAAAIKPLRIAVVTVKSGDTAESLGQKMAVNNSPVERFRVLNGLAKTEQPKPGTKVKIVQ